MAALRRETRTECYVCDFSQDRQAVLDPLAGFHAFVADVVMFALDARSVIGEHVPAPTCAFGPSTTHHRLGSETAWELAPDQAIAVPATITAKDEMHG